MTRVNSFSRRFELVRYFVYSDPEKVTWMKAREKEDSRHLTSHGIKKFSEQVTSDGKVNRATEETAPYRKLPRFGRVELPRRGKS